MDFYSVLKPLLSRRALIGVLKTGVFSREPASYPQLPVTVFGKTLPNPVGIAAGFDTQAEIIGPMFGLGFGFVEVGPVADADLFLRHLAQWRAFGRGGVAGVNVGDLWRRAEGLGWITRLKGMADYIAIDAERAEGLEAALAGFSCGLPRVLVLSENLTPDARREMAVIAQRLGVEGLIVRETGAMPDHLRAVRQVLQLAGHPVPLLISAGGIHDAEAVRQRLALGARLVQVESPRRMTGILQVLAEAPEDRS